MQITRFGHSAVLVEAAGARVLIDPGVFSVDSLWELTDLDAIWVTHQHPDHVDPARIDGLVAANPDALLLAEPQTAATLAGWTPTSDELVVTIGDLTLTGVGTEHATILPTVPPVGNVGVLISADGEPTFFHPGDSYASLPHGVDILAIPLVAPWAKISETVAFVQSVAPKVAFAIHDAVLAERGYGIYWAHIENHGRVSDLNLLGQNESVILN